MRSPVGFGAPASPRTPSPGRRSGTCARTRCGTHQALCLTLVNATVLWATTYLGDALDALRADGYHVTDEAAAHLTPAQHDHINFYGTYSFDVETELHREGRRPLRSPAA